LNKAESVYEGLVDFEKELSVIAARDIHGACVIYPVFENTHANHILDVTFCPAEINWQTSQEAQKLALKILESLEVIGLLTVELFLTKSGRLLVNELAPRTHNSGHLTLNGAVTSQFEQQIRAVTGLPLGSAELVKPAAMANLLGDLWERGEPNWSKALQNKNLKLHLYGKISARPGRKMGHLTCSAAEVKEAVKQVREGRAALVVNNS
jgi:5-(carboxyamino)imidazole ribonucleotide synthase